MNDMNQITDKQLTVTRLPHISFGDSNNYINCNYIVKTIILGEAGVGKSSILRRFTDNDFDTYLAPTIGIDFAVTCMQVSPTTTRHPTKSTKTSKTHNLMNPINANKQKDKCAVFKYQIWDCAGQERYNSIVRQYIRGASVVFLVYDITDIYSFQKLRQWANDVKDVNGDIANREYIFVVVGNKIDQESHTQIQLNEVRKLVSELHALHFEVSAKNNININGLFDDIAKNVYRRVFDGDLNIPRTSIENKIALKIANTSSSGTLHVNDSDESRGGCLTLLSENNCQIL